MISCDGANSRQDLNCRVSAAGRAAGLRSVSEAHPPQRGDAFFSGDPGQSVEDVGVASPLVCRHPGDKHMFSLRPSADLRGRTHRRAEAASHRPSAVIRISATSAGVPTNAPVAPAVIPIRALRRKFGGSPFNVPPPTSKSAVSSAVSFQWDRCVGTPRVALSPVPAAARPHTRGQLPLTRGCDARQRSETLGTTGDGEGTRCGPL